MHVCDDHEFEEEPWQKEALVAGKKSISTIRTKERILQAEANIIALEGVFFFEGGDGCTVAERGGEDAREEQAQFC